MVYDSVVCGNIGTDIGIKYFSLVHAYRIILYLDCDFVGVRMVNVFSLLFPSFFWNVVVMCMGGG